MKTCVEGACWEGKRQAMAPAVSWEMMSGALLWKEPNKLSPLLLSNDEPSREPQTCWLPHHLNMETQVPRKEPGPHRAQWQQRGGPALVPPLLRPDVLSTSCDPAAERELKSKNGHLHHVGAAGQREREWGVVEAVNKGLQRPSRAWVGLIAASLP